MMQRIYFDGSAERQLGLARLARGFVVACE
jgi:hypothetical protein